MVFFNGTVKHLKLYLGWCQNFYANDFLLSHYLIFALSLSLSLSISLSLSLVRIIAGGQTEYDIPLLTGYGLQWGTCSEFDWQWKTLVFPRPKSHPAKLLFIISAGSAQGRENINEAWIKYRFYLRYDLVLPGNIQKNKLSWNFNSERSF